MCNYWEKGPGMRLVTFIFCRYLVPYPDPLNTPRGKEGWSGNETSRYHELADLTKL